MLGGGVVAGVGLANVDIGWDRMMAGIRDEEVPPDPLAFTALSAGTGMAVGGLHAVYGGLELVADVEHVGEAVNDAIDWLDETCEELGDFLWDVTDAMIKYCDPSCSLSDFDP